MFRRLFLVLTLVFLPLQTVMAAGSLPKFDQAVFDKALAEGKAVVVHSHADWCTVCRAQAPHLRAAASDSAFADVVFLQIDVDSDVKAMQKLKFTGQSQLKAFKGGKEVAWEVGVTGRDAIFALVKQAL